MKNAKNFKIVNTLTPNLLLHIEGLDESGDLISEIIQINL
jgi:hypothetical protein